MYHSVSRAPVHKKTSVDMTSGPIGRLLVAFAIPLLLGNLFQQFYNTVDSLVVGNFVGTQALAAVGSTTSIINTLVSFFNGVSVGAGVIISRYYGSHDDRTLHLSVETTMAITFACCILFTIAGVSCVPLMLRFMSTPGDVIGQATVYLRIYFGGIAGLLVYNMGSGILRAVGDTQRPLMFLIFSSVMNVVLDLLFVIAFHMGIAGVAYATIISQFVSALLILLLLMRSTENFRLTLNDMKIDRYIAGQIFIIGLPTGFQQALTSFSNVFVQSYINSFGSSCMAGWSCYIKIDQFVMLPLQSMGQAATTFVSQNVGAGDIARAKRGTWVSFGMSIVIALVFGSAVWLSAPYMVSLFDQNPEVIRYGTLFVRLIIFFVVFCCSNQVMAGALRGVGNARTPMLFMLFSFVLFRQIYLYIATRISNTPTIVGLGYPLGWIVCGTLLLLYYLFSGWEKKLARRA